MNTWICMGRLTKDIAPENVHYTTGDNAMCIVQFDVAVDKRIKKSNDSSASTADFFRFKAFGKTAEFVKNYMKKGTKVVIQARVENDNYTNKDGQKVYRDQYIVESIEFAESKKASETGNVNTAAPSADDFVNAGLEADLGDDSLPFK